MPFGSTPDAGQKQLVGSPQASANRPSAAQGLMDVPMTDAPATALQSAITHANDWLLRGGTGIFPSLQPKGASMKPRPLQRLLTQYQSPLVGTQQTDALGANSNHGAMTPTLPPEPEIKLPFLDGRK